MGTHELGSRMGVAVGSPVATMADEPSVGSVTAQTNPEKLIVRQLDLYAGKLESTWDADVVTYAGPIIEGADSTIRDELEEIEPRRKRLFFIIETSGGYIEVAQRIADTVRHHYGHVEFVIPTSCMSAGTVLVMSGNAIHMDYYSVLGPIDPQVRRGEHLIPALGYLAKYNELIKKSSTPPGLSVAEVTYLVERFDPAELYSFEQARELSVSLLKEWLVTHKFKNWKITEERGRKVSKKMKQDRAGEIADALCDTDRWHSHSRGISMSVLNRKLKLHIDDLESESETHGTLRAYNKLLRGLALRLGCTVYFHRKGSFLPMSV